MSVTIKATEVINLLPGELQARLEADEFFCNIPVVIADQGSVAIEVAKQQAIAGGIAVVVLQTEADDDENNLQFGPMTLYPSFQVFEQVEINRGESGTKKPARVVARRIRDVIKTLSLVGIIATMKTAKPCIVPINNHDYKNCVMYQVNFTCLENFSETLLQVQAPQISIVPDTNTVQIITSTAGATIYYTTDGSYPWKKNAQALPYANPIAVPMEVFALRACAFAPGKIASIVQRAVFNLT